MDEAEASNQIQQSQLPNQSTHLPNQKQLKKSLKEQIQQYINELKQTQGNQNKIQTLNLRIKLIQSHGLSLQRIDNLQAIFLHYCTHIFKTGKHMTFQRLQYEKSHLTMDRFFAFLKDFNLNASKIDGVVRQVIDKNDLVLLFKRVSINAKDLNFEQFISCLQKIGLIYYDSLINYNQRQQKIVEQRKKRKQNYLKSLKRRKAALQGAKGKVKEQQQDKKTQHGQNQLQASKEQQQNDKLVEQMINDKNIQNPIQQVKDQIDKVQQLPQNQQPSSPQEPQGNLVVSINKEYLLKLTTQQKIQYFYQLINVDNNMAFKKKMRELNLPLIQAKHNRNMSQPQQKAIDEPVIKKQPVVENDQQKRLQFLRNKIQQRKQRDKVTSPIMSKQDYQKRKRVRERQEVESTVIVRRDQKKKKIQVHDLQVDLSSLSNMAHQNINFHKFNPSKLIQPSQEQDPYLQEYTTVKKTQRSEKRILSNFESTNDGRSQLMLQKMKKRAQQIEIKQRNAESKYSNNSDALTSTDHQIRKNRLVQKLMKIYKQ